MNQGSFTNAAQMLSPFSVRTLTGGCRHMLVLDFCRQWFSAWVSSFESLVEIRFSALTSDLVIQNLHFQLPFPQVILVHIEV